MNKQITVQDAVRLSKTSDSTVRRWLRGLDSQTFRKYVTKDNGRIFIDRAFFIQSFHLDNVPAVDVDTVDGSHGRPAVNVDSIIEHQARQIDSLLDTVARKDSELLNMWGMVVQLQNELKRLQAGPDAPDGSSSERGQLWAVWALVVVAGALLIYLAVNA